jgi:hypothetical protein
MHCLGDRGLAEGGTVRTDNQGATSAGTHRSVEQRSRWTCCRRARWGRVKAIPCTSLGPCIPAAGVSVEAVINIRSSITLASSTGIVSNAASIIGAFAIVRNSIPLGFDILVIRRVDFVRGDRRSKPSAGL